MTSGVARGRLLLTRLPERPFRPADPRTANRAFQQRRQFDRATPLSDRGDFGAAFWAQAGQNTPLVGARYPHSPSLGSGGAARRPRRNSQHIVRRSTHALSRGLAVGGIAISLRVPPVVRSGALGVGVASRGRGHQSTRFDWCNPPALDVRLMTALQVLQVHNTGHGTGAHWHR